MDCSFEYADFSIILEFKSSQSAQLTKKQRQNLRKKELSKTIREENDRIQLERLDKYRKDQEKDTLQKLYTQAQKDKIKIR